MWDIHYSYTSHHVFEVSVNLLWAELHNAYFLNHVIASSQVRKTSSVLMTVEMSAITAFILLLLPVY